MTREDLDFIGSMNMCDEISSEAYKKIVCHFEGQEPCEPVGNSDKLDCISRAEAIENIKHAQINFSVESDIDFTKHKREVQEIVDGILNAQIKVLEKIPSVTPQEPKTKWIPVSEKLPEDHDWYLIVVKEKSTGYQYIPRVAGHSQNNDWCLIDTEDADKEWLDDLECIAWCPLPEPYKESEGEE